MSLHVVGSHFTYAEVPFGYALQRWFEADRNMYDRLVHLAFGLLLAYPLRELLLRVAKTRGVWGYVLPVAMALAFSAFYEIIEWLVAVRVDPQAGLAFLGATLTMLIVALINWRYDPEFSADLRASLKIEHGDKPLGEEALREMLKKGRNDSP